MYIANEFRGAVRYSTMIYLYASIAYTTRLPSDYMSAIGYHEKAIGLSPRVFPDDTDPSVSTQRGRIVILRAHMQGKTRDREELWRGTFWTAINTPARPL